MIVKSSPTTDGLIFCPPTCSQEIDYYLNFYSPRILRTCSKRWRAMGMRRLTGGSRCRS